MKTIRIKKSNGEILEIKGVFLSTQLKDLKGNEIFEGDVVRCNCGRIGEIVFVPDNGGFIVRGDYSKNQYYRKFNCDEAILSEKVGTLSDNIALTGGCWI